MSQAQIHWHPTGAPERSPRKHLGADVRKAGALMLAFFVAAALIGLAVGALVQALVEAA